MEVRIWVASADEVNLERGRDALTAAELERAEGTSSGLAGRRFLARRLMARALLAEATGLPPAELVLERDCERCGKPHPANPIDGEPSQVWWSASSSAGLAAVAISSRRLGLDLEREGHRPAWQRIARRFYTPAEARAVAETPAKFLDLWTMKEAYLKALGLGLAGGLSSLDCTTLTEPIEGWSTTPSHPRWRFAHLTPRAGFTAAVAVEGTPDSIEVTDWDPEAEEPR